jgi:MFS family permease
VGYRRDRVTWVAFAALLAFGVLNAGLGASLPYIRAAEHVSYLGGVLHQVAFALGGGLAGAALARDRRGPGRTAAIALGLGGAGAAWLGVGYGGVLALTAAAAFLVSLLATTALIRLWAVLADVHGERRAVAMTEGEVAVSLGGIVAGPLIGLLAATALGWRSAFLAGALVAGVAAVACVATRMPPSARPAAEAADPDTDGSRRLPPTLVVVVAIVGLEFALSFWLASYLTDDVGVGRRTAVAMVGGLYAANLGGRLLASRLARAVGPAPILAGAIGVSVAGMPILLGAGDGWAAAVGITVTGAGIGALFPLTSSLHVEASPRSADGAIGQVLLVAAAGQLLGPLAVAALAQASGLRVGLLVLPVLALLAALGLQRHTAQRQVRV